MKNMFSGNFLKMLGIGAIGGLTAGGIETLTAAATAQRQQALGIGGNVGRMKAAQIELAQFGDVNVGLQAARTAKNTIGSKENTAYKMLKFTQKDIDTMDPSTLYAQALIRAQNGLKAIEAQLCRI